MFEHDADAARRSRATLFVYLSALGALLLAMLWVGRFVLFQPWTAREWVSGAAIGRTLYLFGGRSKGGGGLVESYRIDIPSRRIHRAADLPSERFATAVAATPVGIAVLGGYSGTRVLDDVLLVDHRGGLRATGALPSPRAFAAAAAVGLEVYCIGGWTGQMIVDDLTAVDPATGASRLVGRLPSAREQAAAAASGGRLYVAGGIDAAGTYLDEVLEIAPADGAVLRRARLPAAIARCAAVPVDSGVILIGGWTGREERTAFLVDNRGSQLLITALADLPRALFSVTAVPHAGEIVIAGGADEEFSRQIGLWAWNPESGSSRSIKLRSFLAW